MKESWLTYPLARFFSFLLGFFPQNYQLEYAEEQSYAFRMALMDAQKSGGWAVLMVAWRELRDFPLALLQACVLERNLSMKQIPGAHLPGEPVTRWRLVAALLPFVLFILYSLLVEHYFPRMSETAMNLAGALVLAMILGLMGLAVYGGVRGMPTWSLPAWSIPFFIVGLLSIQSAYSLFAWPAATWERMLVTALRSLVSYTGILVLGLALLFLVRPFYRRVRQDWTLLAFLIYCGFPLYAELYDPYYGLEIYEAGTFVLLGLGALAFLLVPKRWQRFGVLVGAVILAFSLLAWGIYSIYPQQPFARGADSRLWEGVQPLLMLPGMILSLALALPISRIPGIFWRERQPAGGPA
jgi:hypothetical protein